MARQVNRSEPATEADLIILLAQVNSLRTNLLRVALPLRAYYDEKSLEALTSQLKHFSTALNISLPEIKMAAEGGKVIRKASNDDYDFGDE